MRRMEVICLIFLCLILSCKKTSDNVNKLKCPVYSFDNISLSEFNVSEIADFQTLIPLQTLKNSLIGNLKKVFIKDNSIIVWDDKLNDVLLFNLNGEFEYTIGRKGNSPEEYIRITDVYVSNDTIQIFDNGSRRILRYNINGEFMGDSSIGFYLYSFFPVENGVWGVNSYQNKNNYYLIHISLLNDEMDYGFFPSKTKLPLIPTNSLTQNEITRDILFHYCYDDNIYKIEKNELMPYISVDFGSKKAPYHFDKSQNLEFKMRKTNYWGEIHNLYNYGKHLFFSFKEKRADSQEFSTYNAYISTDTQEIKIFSRNVKHAEEVKIQPLPEIINISNGKLIYQIVPEILPSVLTEKLQEMLPSHDISNESNPILVIYNLK